MLRIVARKEIEKKEEGRRKKYVFFPSSFFLFACT